jgi:ribosomal protein S6--L-glutamate ligase
VRLCFLRGRLLPLFRSRVVVEVSEILSNRGWDVETVVPEEMLQRPDRLAVEHDLYILKSLTELSLSLAGILHGQGARILSPYPSCALTQNKIVASRVLRAAGVPTPDCWVTGELQLLRPLVERHPLILKPYNGHRGQGLHVVRTVDDLMRVQPPDSLMLAQTYIEGTGEDFKVNVVGEDVFAIRKPFSKDSFTQPGRPAVVSPEIRAIALRCGQAFGLGLYGLDLIENEHGVWVVDVNTFPGYKGIPDVAPRIADYIEAYATGRLALAPGRPAAETLSAGI